MSAEYSAFSLAKNVKDLNTSLRFTQDAIFCNFHISNRNCNTNNRHSQYPLDLREGQKHSDRKEPLSFYGRQTLLRYQYFAQSCILGNISLSYTPSVNTLDL